MTTTNDGFLNSFVNLVTGTSLNRIGRAKYISRNIIFGLITSVCSSIISRLGVALESSGFDRVVYLFLGLPLVFFSIYGSVRLNNKRFHDRGGSGWWQLLLFIPLVNFFVIIYLWFFPGDKGANEYGEQAETQTREKVLAWILPILMIFVIVGILAAALLPRLQGAQSRAKDVARKTHLSQIQSAIVASQMFNGEWPGMDAATNGVSVSNIESDLVSAGLTSVPTDPTPTNKNSGLGNGISNGEYLYLVATRNSVPNGGFVLMAKTDTEASSNWVVCDNNDGKITTETDLADIKPCDVVSKGNSCSSSNCTYTSPDQLRYILISESTPAPATSSGLKTWVDTIGAWVVINRSPNSNHDNIEIWAYNYPLGKSELITKAPSSDKKYEIEITCDFINKYTMDAKSEFSLVGLFDDGRSYSLNFEANRGIYENKGCGVIPNSTTDADLVKIDEALSTVTHVVDGEWLTFTWEKIDTAEWVSVSIFDYNKGTYHRLFDTHVSDGNFVKRLDCDFANKYYDNGKVTIKLTSPTGKEIVYAPSIKSDILDNCLN